jgi:hypothetical protein
MAVHVRLLPRLETPTVPYRFCAKLKGTNTEERKKKSIIFSAAVPHNLHKIGTVWSDGENSIQFLIGTLPSFVNESENGLNDSSYETSIMWIRSGLVF